MGRWAQARRSASTQQGDIAFMVSGFQTDPDLITIVYSKPINTTDLNATDFIADEGGLGNNINVIDPKTIEVTFNDPTTGASNVAYVGTVGGIEQGQTLFL